VRFDGGRIAHYCAVRKGMGRGIQGMTGREETGVQSGTLTIAEEKRKLLLAHSKAGPRLPHPKAGGVNQTGGRALVG
jgi:hypothetical protein